MTYQLLVRKGEVKEFAQGREEGRALGDAEGAVRTAREMVVKLAQVRFDPATPEHVAALNAVTDVGRLQTLAERVLEAGTWGDLLQPAP